MITSYFTDPLEKTDSSNWADRKHTQDEVEDHDGNIQLCFQWFSITQKSCE